MATHRKVSHPNNRRKTDVLAHEEENGRKSQAVVIPGRNIIPAPELDFEQKYIKKDRAVKIIKEMSEFLRILTLQESDILKTMIVRFAIESIEASQGSLLVRDPDSSLLRYQDTYLYENNRIILESFGEILKDVVIRPGEGIVGEAFEKGVPILVEDLSRSAYPKPVIAELMKIDIGSMIAIPLKIDNEVEAVLEISSDFKKRPFTGEDLETLMIIANFASTQLDNAKLFLWAIHDSLTGLYNGHYFGKELANEIEKSKRYGRVFCYVMFDIDNFKHVNDGYGHSSGDMALRNLADCIRKTIRKEVDIAARYGGDEFVIVLSNTNAEDGLKVCERLLATVRSQSILSSDGREFGYTLSMGIAEFPRDGEESYFLFNHADEALYASKRSGKNCISIFKTEGQA
jgi:diguanylate cyclase (GGDEF)-like protein